MNTEIRKLVKAGNRKARMVMDAFNPDQPRDERGRTSEAHKQAAILSRATSPSDHATAFSHVVASEAHKDAATALALGSPNASGLSQMARNATQKAKAEILSRTQKELPSIPDSISNVSTRLAAPHAFLPAGNEKSPVGRLANDPNRKTQQLPAVGGPSKNPGPTEAFVQSQAAQARLAGQAYLAARAQKLDKPMSRQDRVQAAASSAGHWASRNLNTKIGKR